ncbi:MAG: hypothetical protein ACP5T7_08910, partial [bacterium]
MQQNNSTNLEVNKVKIRFTNKKLTAYGGFSLLAAFFERIKLREAIKKAIPVEEVSPNGMGIYSKILAYSLMLYAGGSRFSHILYLGSEQILSTLFATNRLPRASTTLTRLFGQINKLKDVEWMSDVL